MKLGNRLRQLQSLVCPSFQLRWLRSGEGKSEAFGGERNRVHLRFMLKEAGHLLLTRWAYQRTWREYATSFRRAFGELRGCAVGHLLHDRCVLDRICTHILAFEGDSSGVWFEAISSDTRNTKRSALANCDSEKNFDIKTEIIQKAKIEVWNFKNLWSRKLQKFFLWCREMERILSVCWLRNELLSDEIVYYLKIVINGLG